MYRHGSCTQLLKFNFAKMLCISFAHRRGDSGCPCSACLTGSTCPWLMGVLFKTLVYQCLNASSIVTYRGALGAGTSAKALVASAPITIEFVMDARLQNRRAPDCSRAAAYVWSRVTVPFCLGLPLQTQRAFLVPLALTVYVHINGRTLQLGGRGVGSPNMPCE